MEREGNRGEEENKQETTKEVIEEGQGEVRDSSPSSTAHIALDAIPHEPQQFDWVMETDTSIGLVPNPSDFRPTTPSQPNCAPPKPLSPLVSPQPAPSPHTCNLCSNQRGHVTVLKHRALSEPTVTSPNGDIAPHTRTPATGASTAPPACTPTLSRDPPIARVMHQPRDLTALRSDAPNPW